MKFTCEKNNLTKEISIAQEIISSKNALSILSNVLMEAENNTLTIKATDLKVGFETSIPVDISVPGSTTIYCDKFLSILRSLPDGDIEFELKDGKLYIKPLFKKINFQLKSIASEQYPEMQKISDESFFVMPQSDLIEMIGQTIFAVSDDETRYFMNGVYLENIEGNLIMVATDGRRLSYIKKSTGGTVQPFSGVIIPPKVLQLVSKQSSGEGTIQVAVTEKSIFFKFDNQTISSSLIEGQFPNYNRVIPDSQSFEIIVRRDELVEAVKRVSLLVENKSRRIFLNITSGMIELNSEESEIGVATEEIECVYEGSDLVIALNYSYLTDPLRVIRDDNIKIMFTESNKAITVQPAEEADYFHIVMPMQLD
jgi:DNA polymerase-3 subunit beta